MDHEEVRVVVNCTTNNTTHVTSMVDSIDSFSESSCKRSANYLGAKILSV